MADPRDADPAASSLSGFGTAEAKEFDKVREREARDAGEDGGGREETPRNIDDASQGQFHDPEQDRLATETPG